MRRRMPDLLIIALLFVLPLILFWQQTIGGSTLIPTENLYQWEPYASQREAVGAPVVPHNPLVSDLILQNYQWKSFIRESISQGEFPFWNPHQFAGIPFLAAGQQSTLYPFSALYYVLPLPVAYGWFTVVQLWLAGVFMYAFMRGVMPRAARMGAALSGVVYQLSAFFVISAVFPMIIGAAVWLPLILLMIEFVIRRQALHARFSDSTVIWVTIGAIALGCNILAGHVEITYYTLLISAYYALARLIIAWREQAFARTFFLHDLVRRVLWLCAMMGFGLALGGVQFIPLFELVSQNFRSGSASLEQVLSWAHPMRDIIQFFMPNFYGNPTHHHYVDVFTGETVAATVNLAGDSITAIDWGIKNYVEGALYLGILPLILSAFALIAGWLHYRRADDLAERRHFPMMLTFALLALLSLTFMFGLPTYAILYYGFPGIDQLHSPFRWIWAVTFSVAALAGYGLNALLLADARVGRVVRVLTGVLCVGGAVILAGLFASRVMFDTLAPTLDGLIERLALASRAFADAQMFYSYQFTNVLILGVMLLSAGVVLALARHKNAQIVGVAAVALVAADLMIASWGFNPASDPALLDHTPPAIAWLTEQEGDWRYTTLDDPHRAPLFNANMTMRYGLDDIRGYDSIITRQYVDYMQQIAPQVQLDFNRVAPFYTAYGDDFDYRDALQSPLLDQLNVRYVVSYPDVDLDVEGYALAYEDESVRIWENLDYLPRAYTLTGDDLTTAQPAPITHRTAREYIVDVTIDAPATLILSETHFDGWRAYIRPQGAADDQETPLVIAVAQENFQQVTLDEAGAHTVRFVYSSQSFQIGGFTSFMSGLALILLVGVWAWRQFVTVSDDSSTTSRVAKNSVAPILLNLFNRGVDFAFAAVMMRILGPSESGVYYYAVIVFGWFDIFTNFGLNLFLTREVARDRTQAARILANTSVMRLFLAILGIPLLLVFLYFRQTTVDPPLTASALMAIGLLYVGLLPNSFSTGLSALFYAFERAEVPAAIATIATFSKTIGGVAVLLAGLGVSGIAGVSIVTNLLTLAVMLYAARGMIWNKIPKPAQTDKTPTESRFISPRMMLKMASESWPLMLNHFLANIFFQIDIILIEAMHSNIMVGQYSVAYKWVMALNIIPSFFTQALLPVMSRQAQEDRDGLRRSYQLAIKLLLCLALPIALVFTFLAEPLTLILSGQEFLPDGAIALQFMIWSIPIGWMNSLTQYVLIALDLQRRITWAFIFAVAFNLIANFLFIPTYGYRAAALITIASEAALFIPFALLLGSGIKRLNWLDILWRPLVAAGAMLAVLWVGSSVQPLLALVFALAIYPATLYALKPFTPDEWSRLTPLLPRPLRKLTFAQTGG